MERRNGKRQLEQTEVMLTFRKLQGKRDGTRDTVGDEPVFSKNFVEPSFPHQWAKIDAF